MNVKACVCLLFLIVACTNGKKTLNPSVKRLTEAVYASGYVVSKNEYEVNAQAEGYVVEKVAEDGAEIKKGDPVYILESGQQSSRFELARKNYAIAANNVSDDSPVLNEIKAALQSSRSKVSFDSLNFIRFKNLLARNATTRSEFDRMKLAYENSTREYELNRSRYSKIKNQVVLEFENAKSQLSIASNEAGKYVVRSEYDGKVFRTLKEKGELVRRGEAVAVIGNDKAYYLQLDIDEQDILKVKPGQNVLVSIDAYPGKVYKATIEKVYPFVNKQQQSVRADAGMVDSLPGYFSGLSVEANIVIREKEKALVIPKSALAGRDTVRVETPDGVKLTRIQTGIETLEEVEVVGGLDGSSKIVVQ
jgi:HlyD family secretion protein